MMGEKKQWFLFQVHFQNPQWSAFYKIWAKENLSIPSYDHWLPWDMKSDYSFFKMQIAVVRGTSCRVRELRWLYPCGCNQVLEAPACDILRCSFCCTNYLLCPHVELLLTHGQTLIFHIIFFFLALVFILWPVQEAHSSSWECLSLADACHMLTYPDMFFLDFSDIFNITIPIWLLFLYVFQWEFIFCFSKVCHRDYP